MSVKVAVRSPCSTRTRSKMPPRTKPEPLNELVPLPKTASKWSPGLICFFSQSYSRLPIRATPICGASAIVNVMSMNGSGPAGRPICCWVTPRCPNTFASTICCQESGVADSMKWPDTRGPALTTPTASPSARAVSTIVRFCASDVTVAPEITSTEIAPGWSVAPTTMFAFAGLSR